MNNYNQPTQVLDAEIGPEEALQRLREIEERYSMGDKEIEEHLASAAKRDDEVLANSLSLVRSEPISEEDAEELRRMPGAAALFGIPAKQ